MAAYDLRIKAELFDDDGNEIAVLDRTYVLENMGSAEQCFTHAAKTGQLLFEGVEMRSGHEETKSNE